MRLPTTLRDYSWLILPLGAGTLLNGVIRPWLATAIGGVRKTSGAGVRGPDVYWVFDPATQAEHPWLVRFLELSDGQMGLIIFPVIAIWLAVHLILRRRRREP
ncbi:hypothetical protein [Brevundimonas faecalis]|uniref:Uncharacterized protein n=1 Tax=Brevundimonas faecalis TaxID=947378 RepID=A0ABV2R7F8_9CAUL